MTTPSDNEQPVTAALPQFIAPPSTPRRRRPTRSSDPAPATSPATDPATEYDGPGEGSDFPESLGGTEEAPTTEGESSSQGSTSKRARLIDPNARRAYAAVVSTVAKVVAGLADARVTRGSGAFLMTDEEAESIAAPASRILARRAPLPTGPGGATDAADVVELVTAFIGYAINAAGRAAGAAPSDHNGIPQDTSTPAGYDVPGEAPGAPSVPWLQPTPMPQVTL